MRNCSHSWLCELTSPKTAAGVLRWDPDRWRCRSGYQLADPRKGWGLSWSQGQGQSGHKSGGQAGGNSPCIRGGSSFQFYSGCQFTERDPPTAGRAPCSIQSQVQVITSQSTPQTHPGSV